MFGVLESLTKATVNVATLPVDIAADVVTLGGTLTDEDKSYTAQKLEDLHQNLKDAGDPEK